MEDNQIQSSLSEIDIDNLLNSLNESTNDASKFATNPPQDSTQLHFVLPEVDDFWGMEDNQTQALLDEIDTDDVLKSLNKSIDDDALEFATNLPQDSTQHHSALPVEPVEDYIAMDGGVPPVPSAGIHEHATNPQPDSTHSHKIIADPILETFFKRHDESPQPPNSDLIPLLENLSDRGEPSKSTTQTTQQHPPPSTFQALELPVSTSQSLQDVSNQHHVHAQQYKTMPTPLQPFGHNHQIFQVPTPPYKRQKISKKRCGCKVTKCLKRYCECYASGESCGPNCSCQGCCNTPEYEASNNNMRHNQYAVYGRPTSNPFPPSPAVQIASVAHTQANSFTTSSNITLPQIVQMAAMPQQQANPFAPLNSISLPQAVPIATMAQHQANTFTTSSNISPTQVVQMVARTGRRAPHYQPQQQHMLMNPAHPFAGVGHRVSSVVRSPSMQIPPRLNQEANNIKNKYWKRLPRE